MPHHSAHKQPINAYGIPSNPPISATGGSPFSQRFQPTQGLDYVGMPGTGVPSPSSMRSHPNVAAGSWLGSNAGLVHRLDEISADHHPGGQTPTRSLSNAASKSFESPHEVAASVLLLAATAIKEKSAAMEMEATNMEDDTDRNGPLKKRKATNAIMRKKSDEAYHISPHSDSSKQTPATTETSTDETATPSTTLHHTPPSTAHRTPPGGSPGSSYDLRGGQALPDSAKISVTKEIIIPPTHVEIPHFPSVLHAVLTESEFAGRVLQWLPHGQAWRVVRWDALRRQVLPKFFSQLREEDSKDGSGSIDAFLWHLSAWGFEEVTDGPDAGAYSHVLFRRELPGLSMQMRFSPSEPALTDSPSSSHGARYILQVPSLASGDHHSIRSPHEEEKKDDGLLSKYPPQVTPGWPNRPIVGLGGAGYRQENMAAEAWKYYTESPKWVGAPVSVQQRVMPPYSPIRVRSGRGAARLPLNRALMQQKDSSPGSARSSFPVSNRGKGLRGAAHRNVAPKPEPSESTSEAHLSPNKPRPILKRRLPMVSRKPSTEEAAAVIASLGGDIAGSKAEKLDTESSCDDSTTSSEAETA